MNLKHRQLTVNWIPDSNNVVSQFCIMFGNCKKQSQASEDVASNISVHENSL